MTNDITNFRPLNDSIVLRRVTQEYEGSKIIQIPDDIINKMSGAMYGEVLAVGNGTLLKNGKRLPPNVEVGDRVITEKYFVSELKLDNDKLYITEGEHIVAVIE